MKLRLKKATRRWSSLLGIVVLAVALVTGGWLAALVFVSPQQVEAAASAPSQNPLIATIEVGDLVETETFPGEVEFASRQEIVLPQDSDAIRSIVTKSVTTAGSSIDVGDVVLEINGAPVFAFENGFPFYRDMGVGDEGPDVAALQAELVSLGYLDASDGVFGERTAEALETFYSNAGYSAPRREDAESNSENKPSDPHDGDGGKEGESKKGTHVYLPLRTALVAKSLPATVRSLPSQGEVVDESTSVVLDAATTQIRVATETSDDLQVGEAVDVAINGGNQIEGIVSKVISLAEDSDAGEEDPDGAAATSNETTAAIVLAKDGEPIPTEYVGRVATVIATQSTLAKEALLLPVSAVARDGDGAGKILLRNEEGDFVATAVKVLATFNGVAAIESTNPDVRVGAVVRLG